MVQLEKDTTAIKVAKSVANVWSDIDNISKNESALYDILVDKSVDWPQLSEEFEDSNYEEIKEEDSITSILSVDKEFGWTSNYKDFSQSKRKGHVPLYYIRNGKRFVGYKNRKEVDKSADLIDCWKVLIPAAGSDGGQRIPDYVLGKSLIAGSPSVCTQSYLFFKLNTQDEAESMQSYLTTRFFRFLVSLRKITQHATKSTYTWVPMQTWDRVWTDEQLFDKYKLSKRQITHIENLISPVELND